MNPEYKEISYHQLMKKIEVLNELNTDQKWFYNKLSEADGAFGSAAKDKKVIQARKKYQLVIDNKLSTEEQRKKAQDILHDEIDAINSEPNEETDTQEDGDTSENNNTTESEKKPGFFKKVGLSLLDTFKSGMGRTNLGGALQTHFTSLNPTKEQNRRGSNQDCQKIRQRTSTLGKTAQNEILKSSGCAEIP